MKRLFGKRCLLITVTLSWLLMRAGVSLAEPSNETDESSKVAKDRPDNASASRGPNHQFFNLHLSLGGAFALGDTFDDRGLGSNGGQGTLGVDFVLIEPLALSFLGGYSGYAAGDQMGVQDLFIGAGLRLRFLSDKKGAWNQEGGNPWGNLWFDFHLSYHHYEQGNHGGFNVGLGYDFSLAKDFNMGPYVRFQSTHWGDDLDYAMISCGLQFSLAGRFRPADEDNDGVLDDKDKCVSVAEDADGFEDEDGCPDEDNDGDKVPDAEDQCPDIAGSGSAQGCLDNDADKDGILNEVDKCPEEAEDADSFEDEDGCPEADNDGDGLPDEDDKCPGEAEDKDGHQDGDGCPDADNDADGVLDGDDGCPNIPETKNGKEDDDGCPDLVKIDGKRISTKIPIEFVKKGDSVLDKSLPILDEIATILAHRKEMKIRIEGHTDNTGKEKANLSLSKNRAVKAKEILQERGVAGERIEVEGLGSSKPVGDNKTKDGRKMNNRLEFHILGKTQPGSGK